MKRIKGGDIGVGAGYSGHSTTSMSIKPSLDTRHSVDRPPSSHKARTSEAFVSFQLKLNANRFSELNDTHVKIFSSKKDNIQKNNILLLVL